MLIRALFMISLYGSECIGSAYITKERDGNDIYAKPYGYFASSPKQMVGIVAQIPKPSVYHTFSAGYHGYFGRAYNYGNFGFSGIYGAHGSPIYGIPID